MFTASGAGGGDWNGGGATVDAWNDAGGDVNGNAGDPWDAGADAGGGSGEANGTAPTGGDFTCRR